MSPNTKVIYEFVKRFLIPKGDRQSGRTSSNSRNTMIICCLLSVDEITFPRLFCKHLLYVWKGEQSHALPYGSLISYLCQKKGVDVSHYEPNPKLNSTWDQKLLAKWGLGYGEGAYFCLEKNKEKVQDATPKEPTPTTTAIPIEGTCMAPQHPLFGLLSPMSHILYHMYATIDYILRYTQVQNTMILGLYRKVVGEQNNTYTYCNHELEALWDPTPSQPPQGKVSSSKAPNEEEEEEEEVDEEATY